MASKKTASSVETVASVGAGGDVKAKVVKMPKTTETPTTLGMVMEALRKNIDRKGASVPAIRAYILTNYPSVDPVRLRMLLRRALIRGMEKGLLIRPNNSTATGATGRFKASCQLQNACLINKGHTLGSGRNFEEGATLISEFAGVKWCCSLHQQKKKIVKKVSENTDPNEATGPKAKKLPAKKTKPSTTKSKAAGDADGKSTVKRAATKGETAAPKAKKATAKVPKAAAKKPKEKGEPAATKSKKPAGAKAEPARASAKAAKTNGKKAAASSVKDSSSTDKDSAKPAANKRGKK